MTNIESKLAEQVANEQRAKQKLLNHFGCQTVDEFYQKYGIDFTKTSIIVSAMVAYHNEANNKEQEQITPELKAAVKLLKRHNKWRRGAEIEPTYPTDLGLAIDTIVKYFEQYSK